MFVTRTSAFVLTSATVIIIISESNQNTDFIKNILIIFLLGICSKSFTQPTDPIPPMRRALAEYYRNYPQEKVYLQLNKQSYFSAETIWFSGCITYQSKPSPISNTVYVELFNDKGFVVTRAMLPVKKGMVSGEFLLPAGLRTGDYYIRAYTAWMLNFNTSLFFYRKISIADKGPNEKKTTATGHNGFSVQFFPEGGNLVNRLTSLVAFKAVDSNGLPVNTSGKIFNNLGDTIALLKTEHDGMGSFVIHCTPQTIYTALVTVNGITQKIPLPDVQKNGIVFHAEAHHTEMADSVFFHISRTGIDKEKFENLILCAQMENHFSVTKIHFNDTTFNDPLDTILTAPYPLLLNNFSTGVLQLSVMNESGTVLAERLLFLHGHNADTIQLNQLAATANNSTKNFSILMPDDYSGTLAISVTDADNEIYNDNSPSIHSAIFLSADINSPVHEPDWYFSKKPGADHAFDVLLMTCKPARANAQTILGAHEQRIKYLPEKSITLKGRAFEMNDGVKIPVANGSLFLFLKAVADSVSIPLSVTTDSAGFFIIPDLYFHDTAAVFVQTGIKTQGQASNNIAITIYKNVFDSIAGSKYVIAPTVLNGRLSNINADSMAADKQAGMLQNVTITARAKTHLDSVLAKYASGMFANPGSWAATLDLTNDPITTNSDQDVLGWLNGKVAGLTYSFSNGKPLIYWRYSNVIIGLSNVDQLKLNAPAFFLNEMLLSAGPDGYDGAIDLLSGIRMADVALIRVYKPGTMPNVPDNGPHGSVAIWLKKETDMNKPTSKISFEKSTKAGYKLNRQFSNAAGNVSNGTTLYWNPALEVDPVTHTASFNFTGTTAKRLQIIAQGLDINGKTVRLNKVIANTN